MSAGTGNSADITAVIGASGNGKGLFVKEELRRWRGPILVWSELEETDKYAAVIGGTAYTSIAAAVEAIGKGKTRIVIVPPDKDKAKKVMFDRFCRVAWQLNDWCVVVEELSNVTMPSWAPPAWKKLSTAGRHKGLKLMGICQRPAMMDKAFFGNCTQIRCYGLVYKDDAKSMGDVMRVTADELLDLPKFHYRHRDVQGKTTVAGVVSVPKTEPRAKK